MSHPSSRVEIATDRLHQKLLIRLPDEPAHDLCSVRTDVDRRGYFKSVVLKIPEAHKNPLWDAAFSSALRRWIRQRAPSPFQNFCMLARPFQQMVVQLYLRINDTCRPGVLHWMRRRVVLISPKYEMCLQSMSTVPLATDCWLSKRPIVSKEVRPMADVPYRGTLMARFAQPRRLSENAMSYGHRFRTSHCSPMWRPADRGETVALAHPCGFSRCQTTFLEGHRVRDLVMLTSGNGTITPKRHGGHRPPWRAWRVS